MWWLRNTPCLNYGCVGAFGQSTTAGAGGETCSAEDGRVWQYSHSSKSLMFLQQHYLVPLFMSVFMLHNERGKKEKKNRKKIPC